MSNPKVSIIVPVHPMKDGDKFLWRLVNSLTEQSFKDWELIITKDGKMAENTNAGIKRARGEWIKIMYLDDYFIDQLLLSRAISSLNVLDRLYKKHGKRANEYNWAVFPTDDNPSPYWTENIETGNNKIGSPSAIMLRNYFEDNLLFDESLSWLLDCDYYKRLNQKVGKPFIFEGNNTSSFSVGIGKGDHQMTHILTNEQKLAEHEYLIKKYE